MTSEALFQHFEDQRPPRPEYLTSPDLEVRARVLAKLEAMGEGWKLHLNFDADDSAATAAIRDLLTAMVEQGYVANFKIGHGGGKVSGQPGKEATVRVGDRDKAAAAAVIIEELADHLLLDPEGEALQDDTLFTAHVMGRFDISRYDPDFQQYGGDGVPYIRQDANDSAFGETMSPDDMKTRAHTLLAYRYGKFYTG